MATTASEAPYTISTLADPVSLNVTIADCDSAIGQHLLDNEQCAAKYNDKRFKILAVARNSFHLCLLEATFIKTKHPVLCKQKEFVYTLKLFK